MPWRLIQFIVTFIIFLLFIMLNLENKCDIHFGFATIKEVPVFLTVFSSFIAGMLCAIPFIRSLKSRKKGGQQKDGRQGGNHDANNGNYGID